MRSLIQPLPNSVFVRFVTSMFVHEFTLDAVSEKSLNADAFICVGDV